MALVFICMKQLDTYIWSSKKAGRVAEEADKDKIDKYKSISNEFYMVPMDARKLLLFYLFLKGAPSNPDLTYIILMVIRKILGYT